MCIEYVSSSFLSDFSSNEINNKEKTLEENIEDSFSTQGFRLCI